MDNQGLGKQYLEEKIVKIQNDPFDPHHENNARWRELKARIILDNIVNRRANNELYLKFAEIVKDKDYFRIEHIQELGLEYDILLFLSEKNIGKSWNMLNRANEIVRGGGQVLFMRLQDVDIQHGLQEQLHTQPNNCINIDSSFRLWNHEIMVFDRKAKKEKPSRAGIAASLKGISKWKGSSFEGYEMMFFDEATDKKDGITLRDWNVFFTAYANSIERRKEKIPMEIFGNTNFDVSSPIFECFGIDPEENLVYTVRRPPGADKYCKILYINSRGLYPRGANLSKFIGAIGDPRMALGAFMNDIRKTSSREVSVDLCAIADPYKCILYTNTEGERQQILINRFEYFKEGDFIMGKEDTKETWYYFKVEEFQPAYLKGYKILTDEVVFYGLHKDFVTYRKDMSVEWMNIRRILRSGRCVFIGSGISETIRKLLDKKIDPTKILLG